jgi:oxygen-dependent protoporphyrinogen oxidase
MKALFPEILRMEQTSGSIVRSFLKPVPEEPGPYPVSPQNLALHAMAMKWGMWSLRNGLQDLAEALVEHIMSHETNPVKIYNESIVEKIEFNPETMKPKLTVAAEGQKVLVEADHIFSALPSSSVVKCLKGKELESLRHKMNQIKFVDVAVASLEFKGRDVVKPDAGFGFLSTSREECPVLGIVYDSCTFPKQDAGKDVTRVTCMMGGEWFDSIFGPVDNVSEDHVLSVAIPAARKYLGFREDPIRHAVSINKGCIPQYYLHHGRNVRDIWEEVSHRKLPLDLLGSSWRGVSVNECIYHSHQAVQQFVDKQSVLENQP